MKTPPRLLLFAGVAIVIVAAGLGAWRLMRPAADVAASPATPGVHVGSDAIRYPMGAPQLGMLRSEPVAVLPLPIADALGARVVYDEDVTARLFAPVAGRIVALKVQAGERVAVGQVLAQIDAPDFGTARADLDKARADEERKRLAWERARELGEGEGIAAKDVEAAHADYEAARAETARAAQRVHNLNPLSLPVEGQRVSLTSPLAGVVSERNATPALEVAPGGAAPLFVVTDPRRLWVLVDLPEKLLPVVRAGTGVAVESDAYPGRQFPARIVQIAQTVDPNTRRVVARAILDNPEGKLLPEMFVRALLLQNAGEAAWVANSAIVTRGIYSYAYVETAPGNYERRRVELALRGADYSYVTQGLARGDKIVTRGALLLDAEVAAAQRP